MWRFTGLAVPYDVVARKSRKRWRFPVGAVLAGAEVPLLRDHDHAQGIGRVTTGHEAVSGLILRGRTRWPVKAGTGLSIGFLPVQVDVVAGERVVRSAVLEEVSIVQDPAWPDCVITEVEEVSTWPRTLAHT
jgi:phage head maturation protease